jgi:peptidoglycan/xylan/chitin deacetylase (PgdA/CDA1 family)
VLLPAPDIGQRARAPMQATMAAGHECGIHTWDHVVWQDNVRRRDAGWTRAQMALSFTRYVDVFGVPPATHGAAGWQMNSAAVRQIDDWHMAYASDCRGDAPFVPIVDGVECAHVQLPTTLPTFDEVIGVDGVDDASVARHLLGLTETDRDQVFTLHAELEGGLLSPAFDQLLAGWRTQGHELVTMGQLHSHLDVARLPRLPLTWGTVPGRSGELMVAAPA